MRRRFTLYLSCTMALGALAFAAPIASAGIIKDVAPAGVSAITLTPAAVQVDPCLAGVVPMAQASAAYGTALSCTVRTNDSRSRVDLTCGADIAQQGTTVCALRGAATSSDSKGITQNLTRAIQLPTGLPGPYDPWGGPGTGGPDTAFKFCIFRGHLCFTIDISISIE